MGIRPDQTGNQWATWYRAIVPQTSPGSKGRLYRTPLGIGGRMYGCGYLNGSPNNRHGILKIQHQYDGRLDDDLACLRRRGPALG